MTREPTEMEMRVAKALIATTGLSWSDVPRSHPIILNEARAAIRAMREPTEEMIEAGFDEDGGRYITWIRMIYAASPEEE